jgi:hypothetical protein
VYVFLECKEKEMSRQNTIQIVTAGLFVLVALPAMAANAVETKQREQVKELGQTKPQVRQEERVQEQIYGSQLMSQQERLEYRNRMRTLKTEEERRQFQLEHHKEMQERAKQRGVTLPDMPPAVGGGMGPGSGMGPGNGMGPGSGMGPGGGRR